MGQDTAPRARASRSGGKHRAGRGGSTLLVDLSISAIYEVRLMSFVYRPGHRTREPGLRVGPQLASPAPLPLSSIC